jgi:uncharacterized protein YaaR (DUF327 family)
LSEKREFNALFQPAVDRYNARQTSPSRRIDDYHAKVLSDKRGLMPVREIIVMIGNCADTGATTEAGKRAAKALKEYGRGFAARNDRLYVLNSVIHMDEATPHIHISFIPFATGYKRGMDTQLSFGRALEQMGFPRALGRAVPFIRWIEREKEEIAEVMERYGFRWDKLGTHDKHLTIAEYRVRQREKEIAEMERKLGAMREKFERMIRASEEIRTARDKAEAFVSAIDDPERGLPKPSAMANAAIYYKKCVAPFIEAARTYAASQAARCAQLEKRNVEQFELIERLESKLKGLTMDLHILEAKNHALEKDSCALLLLKRALRARGVDPDSLIAEMEKTQKKQIGKADVIR